MKPRFDAILPKKVPGALLFKIVSYFRHRGENKVMQTEDNMAETLDQHESAQLSSQQDDDKKPRSGADQLRLLGMPWGVKEKTRYGLLDVTACKHRHLGWQATSIVSPQSVQL
jgi:hypothetical protein